MTIRGPRPIALVLATVATAALGSLPLFSADLRPDYRPAAYAIKGGRVVTGSGPAIDEGTVVVRDGLIEAVGPAERVAIPFDAETIDGKGLVVYPGFLDLYTTPGQDPGVPRSPTGPGRAGPPHGLALPRTPPAGRPGP